MSSEYKLDYFPPKGTKYVWENPSLQHSPWIVILPALCWPQSCICSVDRTEKGYRGRVSFRSIDCNKLRVEKSTRYFKNPLKALLATENIADELLKNDIKPWMKKAINAGWRPPAQRNL